MVLALLALLMREHSLMEEAVRGLSAVLERSFSRMAHVRLVHHSGKLRKMAAHASKLNVPTERDFSWRVSASHVKRTLELYMTERHVDHLFAVQDKCFFQMVLAKIAPTMKEL